VAEEPLDWVALSVRGRVVGPWMAAFAPGRNHGASAADGQGGHERVGIVALVSDGVGRGQPLKQGLGLRSVVALAGAQANPYARAGRGLWPPGASWPSACRGSRPGLAALFLRDPLACWWACTVVESTSSLGKASSCCTASKTRSQTPETA
jgi:hypothetical protein